MLEPKTTTGPSGRSMRRRSGARERLAIGQRGIDAGIHPRAFADDFGEEPKLAHGAPALAGEAIEREARFDVGALRQFVAEGENLLGDALEESGPALGADLAKQGEGFLGVGERAGHILGHAFVKGGLEFAAIERADGAEGARAGFGGDAGDEAFSVESHIVEGWECNREAGFAKGKIGWVSGETVKPGPLSSRCPS